MNHNKLKEELRFYVLDELTEEEKIRLENHILECEECNSELTKLTKLHAAIAEVKPENPKESVLENSRKDLWDNIATKESAPGFFENISRSFKQNFAPVYRFALGSAAALIVGFLLGYLIFSGSPQQGSAFPMNISNLDELMRNNYRLSNIRFEEQATFPDEEFEVTFDAVRPVTIKGNFDEDIIKTLLTTALTTSENPGTRLRTISRIASNSGQYLGTDPKIKEALITAMVSDQNPGVRKEALNVLIQYPIGEKIKEAFLSVLANDPNSGMRVSAINALVKLKLDGGNFDEEVTNTLTANAANDNNKFVQLRAAALLKEDN